MAKVFVSLDATDEKRAAVRKLVADALGVSVDDVVLVPAGCCVSVVDVTAATKVSSGSKPPMALHRTKNAGE